jgi:hypothetical protein
VEPGLRCLDIPGAELTACRIQQTGLRPPDYGAPSPSRALAMVYAVGIVLSSRCVTVGRFSQGSKRCRPGRPHLMGKPPSPTDSHRISGDVPAGALRIGPSGTSSSLEARMALLRLLLNPEVRGGVQFYLGGVFLSNFG